MFEKFDIDSLYTCFIEDIIPMGITNFGGAVSIDYTSSTRYSAVVCLRNGKYYFDICRKCTYRNRFK